MIVKLSELGIMQQNTNNGFFYAQINIERKRERERSSCNDVINKTSVIILKAIKILILIDTH